MRLKWMKCVKCVLEWSRCLNENELNSENRRNVYNVDESKSNSGQIIEKSREARQMNRD